MTNRHNEIGKEEAELRKELHGLESRAEVIRGLLHTLSLEKRKLRGQPVPGDIVRAERSGEVAKVSKVWSNSYQSMKGFLKKKDGTFSKKERWLWDHHNWKVVKDET